MNTFALDTNIISFMVKGDEVVCNAFRSANSEQNIFVIPIPAYYEIRRGLLAVNALTQMKAFDKLCESFDIKEMNLESWEMAANIWANLRRRGSPVGKDDGDIFIAATCIVNDYTLVTDNTCDFIRIEGLKFVNWKQ